MNTLKAFCLIVSLLLLSGCRTTFMERNQPERIIKQGKWVVYKTRHFDFYYRPETKTSERIDSIAARQERSYSSILKLFHLYDYYYHVTDFIFKDFEDYDNVTGAGKFSSTYEIGNYGAIYSIDSDTLSNVTDRHEITHFIVDNYFGFGAQGPFQWLVSEGLAVWTEDKWKNNDLYEFAFSKFLLHEISTPDYIVNNPDNTPKPENPYQMAGAFAKYMIDSYGLAKFMNLYQQGYSVESFRQIFGKSFSQINDEFLRFLITRQWV